MASKQLMFGSDAKVQLKKGLDQLASAVKVTMGPTGRNVILQKSFGNPHITKDGVTVSKEIDLPQQFQNMGAKMVNEVAKKTADKAGDGTTTATVLAQAIFSEGLRHVTAGANPIVLQRGITAASKIACDAIDGIAKKCKGLEDLQNVACVSANHDASIGNIIAEAINHVGKDGVVEVEDSNTSETYLNYVEGMQFDKGYLSPYFMTDPATQECELEDCLILIQEKKISNLADILPLLNKVAMAQKPLLIIAEDVEAEALAALVVNRLRGVLKVAAVKAPGFGDRRKAMLGDIATLTGGQFLSEDLGVNLETLELDALGSAKKIIIDKDNTTIIEGAGKKKDLTARCEQIRRQIETTTSDYDKEKLQERLAKLTGGVAIIHVGAATEIELKEKKDRVDDAMHATKAAAAEGYVPGGGVAFIRAAAAIEEARKKAKGDEKLGYDIVIAALEAPLRQIVDNAGEDGYLVVEEVKAAKGNKGYNAATGEYVDMVKAGIIDPARVAKIALGNAASVSGLMLTTDVMITDLKDDEDATDGAVS
ncbi:MAG TPA: chaperonin GroEL [Phycisphaerales bacterium]|nr:chaperonin GroEL [Phycisphaerales bacterium]HCD32776.1 chaperonin GroEL [Phycisphaerales bacterium]|tara:strand:- start:84 stop:1697 length:1614 start_codon:yes stop_codon:yes gene_type:complete